MMEMASGVMNLNGGESEICELHLKQLDWPMGKKRQFCHLWLLGSELRCDLILTVISMRSVCTNLSMLRKELSTKCWPVFQLLSSPMTINTKQSEMFVDKRSC